MSYALYLKEINAKCKPFSVSHTKSLLYEVAKTSVQTHDHKLDDYVFKDDDISEPPSLRQDNFLPHFCNVSVKEPYLPSEDQQDYNFQSNMVANAAELLS